MNYQDAEQKAQFLAAGLDDLAEIVEGQLGLADPAGKLRNRAQKVRDDHFLVLVVGEFKRGKSTLLNAMLGDDVLPRKVAACTAVVTRIQYGEQPHVRVVFDDKRPDDNLSVDEFRSRYQLKLDDTDDREAAMDRFTHVVHALLNYPVELCRHRIELVDSPGLGEHKSRAQRTQKFLSQADAVVFVLHATQFLKADESHFLESILLPMGLRNIFFVINGWNLIDEAVLRPEDADHERAELEENIKRRLGPFCFIHGRDRSSERIFRVNALGALKARLQKPVLQSMLEESCVPDLELSLQRFLVEDRAKARADVILSSIRTTGEEVDRYISTQIALADKSLAEVEAERSALQPKLERLRGIRQHIVGFLQGQSAVLQDRLVTSFLAQMEKLNKELPEEVGKFDLKPITDKWMVWEGIQDWFRTEEDKFKTHVKRCLEPQVQRLLERRIMQWLEAVNQNEMPAVKIDVEKHLQQEAAEYQRVMREIEEKIGIQTTPLQVTELVKRWLEGGGANPAEAIDLPAIAAIGEFFGWLVAGLITEYILEAALHIATGGVTLTVGALFSALRLGWREVELRKKIQEQIVAGIRGALDEIKLKQASEIRSHIREGFDGLEQKIAGSIDEEIAIIDASLQAIIDRKQEKEFSAEQERIRLEKARTDLKTTVSRIHAAIGIS